jgi:hypothetical protein
VQAHAALTHAVDELKTIAVKSTMELDNLRRANLLENLRTFIGSSNEQEVHFVRSFNTTTSVEVDKKISSLSDFGDRTISEFVAAFDRLSAPVQEKAQQNMQSNKEVQNAFEKDMAKFDANELSFIKDFVSLEMNRLIQSWQVLNDIAPAVNESLKTAVVSNIRTRIATLLKDLSQIEAASSQAYKNAIMQTTGGHGQLSILRSGVEFTCT